MASRTLTAKAVVCLLVACTSVAHAKRYVATCSGDSPEFAVAAGQTIKVASAGSVGPPAVPSAQAYFTSLPGGAWAFTLGTGQSTPVSQPMTLRALAMAAGAANPSTGTRGCWVLIEVE
jgi:hypothetical protein